MESNNPTDYDPRLTEDPRPDEWSEWQGSVLLRDQIEFYSSHHPPLIEPFDPKLLEAAGYQLRVGKHCRVEGEDVELSSEKPLLVIPKHGVAIIQTLEKLIMPGFLIGRWNLKVKMVYLGLVWTGSLQVDPGYHGTLFCPLFNLSKRDVEIKYGDPLFVIDFVKTTRYDASRGCSLWKADPSRDTTSIGALDPRGLKSSVKGDFDDFHKAWDDLKQTLERELKESRDEGAEVRKQLDRLRDTTFLVLAIVVSAIAIVASFQFFAGHFEGTEKINWPSLAIAGLAVVLGTIAYLKSRQRKGNKDNRDP